MDKSLKIISTAVLTLLLMFSVLVVKTEAFTDFDKMKAQADAFEEKGRNGKIIDEDEIAGIVAPIGKFLVGVGAFAVIISTIIMGIKYMSAPDPNTQAQIKKQMIGLIVSAIVIFGAYGIWTFIYNFMDDII